MKKKKCLCKYTPVKGLNSNEAIFSQPNYNCPVHFLEDNCEHKWKAGGIIKREVVIFCEKCGKTKRTKLGGLL